MHWLTSISPLLQAWLSPISLHDVKQLIWQSARPFITFGVQVFLSHIQPLNASQRSYRNTPHLIPRMAFPTWKNHLLRIISFISKHSSKWLYKLLKRSQLYIFTTKFPSTTFRLVPSGRLHVWGFSMLFWMEIALTGTVQYVWKVPVFTAPTVGMWDVTDA